MVQVHNVGSLPLRDIDVEAYAGDPDKGGKLIGATTIPAIEPPNDLDARVETASIDWQLPRSGCDVCVLIDPKNTIKDEITPFNNKSHAMLPKKQVAKTRQLSNPEDITGGVRGGRGGRH